MEFIDPHFHYWDLTERSTSGHNAKHLGDVGKRFPTYEITDYINDMKQTGMILKKAVFVEAISDDPLAEAKWVLDLAKRPEARGIIHGVVAYAELQDPNIETLLREYAKYPAIKGIRQILNYHPTNPKITWPKVTQELSQNASWKKGYALLSKYNLSFDLQLNPHQIQNVVKFIAQHPETPVIVNHLCTLLVGESPEENAQAIATWRAGIKSLSMLHHVTMKLSMLSYTKPGWETDPNKKKFIKDIVHEVISLFGTKRCMIGSNFPVDAMGVSAAELYRALREIVADLSTEQQYDLFYGTAEKVYRLGGNSKL